MKLLLTTMITMRKTMFTMMKMVTRQYSYGDNYGDDDDDDDD